MKTSKELLSSITKTAQMGQLGIRCVLDYAQNHDLKQALRSQLDEYDRIEEGALNIAEQRGWEIAELSPAAKLMSMTYTKVNLMMGNIDSRIAAMMINGNTKGMVKSIKNQHHSIQTDSRINRLGEKLLAHETANIRQMQEYL